MEYRRVKSPYIINTFINDPDIKKQSADDRDPPYLDCKEWFNPKKHIAFLFDKGLLLFFETGDRIYNGDIYFLPEKRGDYVKKCCFECIDYMFGTVKADKITTETPAFNFPARYLVSSIGFKRYGKIEKHCLKNGVFHDLYLYELVNGKNC